MGTGPFLGLSLFSGAKQGRAQKRTRPLLSFARRTIEASSIDLRARKLAVLLALAGTPGAFAQSAAAPRFAVPNLSPAGVRALAANCAQCHGTEGHPAPGSVLPALAGRDRRELRALILDFRSGRRRATVMDQISRGYSDAEIAALADYFSSRAR